MHPLHYSPRTPIFLIENGAVPSEGIGVYLQIASPPAGDVNEMIAMPTNAAEYAARLYSVFHELDARGYDWIAVESPPVGVEWEAVLDRLHRAASKAS
jgi:L-threonylcarbamoyladenylate synthase